MSHLEAYATLEERAVETQVLGYAVERDDCDDSPCQMLPWADPYIARLLEQHQQLSALAKRIMRLDDDHRGPRAEALPPLGNGAAGATWPKRR